MTEESLPKLNPGRQLTAEELAASFGPEVTSATWEAKEGNPLPGMQNPMGRLAWGIAEQKGFEKLREKKPEIGKPATLAAALMHLFLANRWKQNVKEKGRP
jgi:hypothetical protein